MTKSSNAITNAETIIERFGGIRPMASKINVAVTTIQGWKKRGVIPAKRREEIIKAAENHKIDLLDLLGDTSVANENQTKETETKPKTSPTVQKTVQKEEEALIKEAIKEAMETQTEAPKTAPSPEPIHTDLNLSQDAALQNALKAERRAAKQTSWITTAIILASLAAVAILLWPQTKEIQKTENRLDAIEANVNEVKSDVTEIKNNGSFFGNLIPTDLEERISKIQEQAETAKQQVGEALKKAETLSNDIIAKDAGTIEQRIEKLEQHASVFSSASPELTDMIGRLKSLSSTLGGQAQLGQSVNELNALVGGLSGNVSTIDNALGGDSSPDSMNDLLHSTLITAKDQSPTLAQTFEGIPPENMKAAAILLGFSQFRSALNRDNKAFDGDLALLSNLIGDDNPELQTAITQLAPHANNGVLSSTGLSKEFRSIAGELVVSSLKGEDVSITEKAQAHFNEILTVEKNGTMVSGTTTQQKVSQAQNMLDNGNVAEAITLLQSMDGEAANITAPFLEQAQTTLLAKQVESMLGKSLDFDAMGLDTNTIINTIGNAISNGN